MTNPAELVEELEIAAPPARVFEALVQPEQLRRWWGSDAMYRTTWVVDLRVGGEFICLATAPGAPEMTVRGRFLAVDPPRHLAYTWNASWDDSGETRVDYSLLPTPRGTLVRVTQTGFGSDADRAGYREGWTRILVWLNDWITLTPAES
ncbi:MAG: SRPBCC domain-containing protein [Gemmatimonadota bacterium]